MLKNLRKLVYVANKRLTRLGLTDADWGNVSGIERERGLVVVKPGDISCKDLTPDDMIVINLKGKVVEGQGTPASDFAVHLHLYKTFSSIGGVVSAYSIWATIFAQAGLPIPAYGTRHIEFFKGDIPCTRALNNDDIADSFEKAVASAITDAFTDLDPMKIPSVLVKNHAPFTWGESPIQAVYQAAELEKIAKMAYHTSLLGSANKVKATTVPQALINV